MKIVQKLWTAAGLACRRCGGKGYVVDSVVADFIAKNGLATFQAATALMSDESLYGELGSLPVVAWEELGMPADQATTFLCKVADCYVVHSCPDCGSQPNHPDALKTALEVLDRFIADRRREQAQWEAMTPSEHEAWIKGVPGE